MEINEACVITVVGREFRGWIRGGSYPHVKIDMSGSLPAPVLPVDERKSIVIFEDDKVEVSKSEVDTVLAGGSISIRMIFQPEFVADYQEAHGERPSREAVVRRGSPARAPARPAPVPQPAPAPSGLWDRIRALPRRLRGTGER